MCKSLIFLFSATLAILLSACTAFAQVVRPVVPIVTDQSALNLSNNFGQVANLWVDAAGDAAFTDSQTSAVFLQKAGAKTPTRLFQSGDPVPGVPGAHADYVIVRSINSSGAVAFSLIYETRGVLANQLLVSDGTTLKEIADSSQLAGVGIIPGRSMVLNDAGDTSFAFNQQGVPTKLYIAPAGSAPVVVAAVGAPAPGGTLQVVTPLNVPAGSRVTFNNNGELLFSATVNGNPGLYVASIKNGLRKIAANADPAPGGGTFNSFNLNNAALNNLGQVVFIANVTSSSGTSRALWVSDPTKGLTQIASTANPAPVPGGGTYNAPFAPVLFNDEGDVVFPSAIAGNPTTNSAIFRGQISGAPTQAVAYSGELAPGVAGATFVSFSQPVSINSSGAVVFATQLSNGQHAIYTQTGTNAPTLIALDGEASGDGGNFSLAGSQPRILGDNSVVFAALESSGPSFAGLFHSGTGSFTKLVNSSDPLPSGAGVSLRNGYVSSAGPFLTFFGLHTGGQVSAFLLNSSSGALTKIASDGDSIPGLSGTRLVIPGGVVFGGDIYVNASGAVALDVNLAATASNTAVLLWNSTQGLVKLAADGDVDAATGQKLLFPQTVATSSADVSQSPINSQGAVLITTTLSPSGQQALYLASAGSAPSKVIATGDSIGGLTITDGSNGGAGSSPQLNSNGQVVVNATLSDGSQGLYLTSVGGPVSKIVKTGDPGPNGLTFTQLPGFFSLNDSGEVAFFAGYGPASNGVSSAGVFIGTASAPPQNIALDGAPAPSGGNFSIQAGSCANLCFQNLPNDVLINDEHDLAFSAALTGGASNSGYFLRRGAQGVLQTVALQGQPAPGTNFNFTTFTTPGGDPLDAGIPGYVFALGPQGQLEFQNEIPGQTLAAVVPDLVATFYYGLDNSLTKIIAPGDPAPGISGGQITQTSFGPGLLTNGLFAFWAATPGSGTTADAIYITENPIPIASTLAPTSSALGQPVNITITGSNIVPGAVVEFNGTDYPGVSSADGTTITATIPETALQTSGTVPVLILNPAPGGGASNALSFTISAPATPAGTIAFTPPPNNTLIGGHDPNNPVNLGNVFTPNSDVWVTSLGFYAENGWTTYVNDETVTIYDSAGNALASAVVSRSGPVLSRYYWQNISPIHLQAGQQYTVSMYVGNNAWTYGGYPATPSQITFDYDDYLYPPTPAPGFPTQTAAASGPTYYGPNFTFVNAAPAPSIGSGSNLGTFSIGEVQAPLNATGGNGSYTWALVSGSLPPGISLRTDTPSWFPSNVSAGLIGIATTPGNYGFTLSVSSGGQTVTQAFTMAITALQFGDVYPLPDAFVNNAYSYQLGVQNNQGPITFTAQSGLPPGITLSASGLLSGTPTQSGYYNLQIQLSDGVSTVGRSFQIGVFDVQITTPGVLPNTTQGAAYNATIVASGGTPPYRFTSNGMPGNLVLDINSGNITGSIPYGPGIFYFNVTATDANGHSYSKEMIVDVVGTPPLLPELFVSSATGLFDDCALGTDCYNAVNVNSGGTAPFTWTATGLPPGLHIGFPNNYVGVASAQINGIATQLGTFNVTVTVTDATGAIATNIFPLHVSEIFQDYQDRFPSGSVGVPYSFKTRVIGGTGPYTLSADHINLPNGLTFDGSNFLLSGTANEAGGYNLHLDFADTAGHHFDAENYFSFGYPANGTQTLNIGTGGDLGTITVGQNYNNQLNACCVPSLTWTLYSGTLPPGITLSGSGLLSGVPTLAGTYNFAVQVADANNSANFALRYLTLTVTPIFITTAHNLPVGNVGTAYTVALTAGGGTGPYTWSQLSGQYLPPGLAIASGAACNAVGGGTCIAGTPTASGQFNFSLRITDAAGNVAPAYFDVSIYPAGVNPPLDLPIGPDLGIAIWGKVYYPLQARGGVPPYHYSLTPGANVIPGMRVQDGQPLPTWFSQQATGGFLGIITAVPAVPYSTSLRVTDAAGNTFDRPVHFTVTDVQYAGQNPPNATVNVPFSYTLQVIGGSGNFTFFDNGGLPPGLSVNSSGVVSGTPTVAGTYNANFFAVDLSNSERSYFGIQIVVDPFAITTPGIVPEAIVGAAFSQQFSAPGCGNGCTWSLFGGLPGNVSFNPSGLLSGTPSYNGNFTFTVQATGSNGTVQKQFSWQVETSTPQSLFISMPSDFGTVPFANNWVFRLDAQGGTAPYSWAVTSGSLPPGMSLYPAADALGNVTAWWATPGHGIIAGPPRQLGQFSFTLQVTDANNQTASQAFTMEVSPIGFEYYGLPIPGNPLVYNQPYSQPLLAVGGDGNYTWTAIDSLPTGLSLTSSGVVTGTPAVTGGYYPQIRVTDGQNNYYQWGNSFNISSATTATLTFNSGPNLGTYQQGFEPTIFLNPAGGVGPYTINISGPLPPGFVLLTNSGQPANGISSSNFYLTGVPMAVGTFSFTAQIQDTQGNVGAQTFTLSVVPFTLFNNTNLADGSVGVPYSVPLVTFDNTGTPVWAVAPGSTLPPGLSLSSSGLISGTPSQAGQFSFQVTATDGGATFTYGVNVHIANLAITDAQALPDGMVGVPYNYSFAAAGTPGVIWSATGLPGGLHISPSGVISGTPSGAGRFSVFVIARNSTDHVQEHFVLYVTQPNPGELTMPSSSSATGIVGGNLPDASVGQNYQFALLPSGGMPPYTFTLATGSSLPPGLALYSGPTLQSIQNTRVPAVTVLAGVPSVAGNYSFTLVLTDAAGRQTTGTLSLNVSALALLPNGIPDGTSGTAYSQQFNVVGGTGPYLFRLTPIDLFTQLLPTGFSMSQGGLLSGTTSDTGDFGFVLHVKDANGNTFSASYFFSITNAKGLKVYAGPLSDDWVGSGSESFTQFSTSGNSTYTWSVVSGTVPPGMQVQEDDNDFGPNGWGLTGAPNTPGTYTFKVRATDNADSTNFAEQTLTLRVSPFQKVAPPFAEIGGFITLRPLPIAVVGTPYSFTFKIAGGTPPYNFHVSPTSPLPAGLSLSADGTLSGVPQSSGQFQFIPVVTDAVGYTQIIYSAVLVVIPANGTVPLLSGLYPKIAFEDASVGAFYHTNLDDLFTWHRGFATQVWSLAKGSTLPPGIALMLGSNGVPTYLGGVPTAVGNYNFQLTAADPNGQTLTFDCSLTVNSLALSPDSLPAPIVGSAYSASLVASGGTAPYTIGLAPYSDLPPGLSLNSSGVLSGTPTNSGEFFLFITVSDANGKTLLKSLTLNVDSIATGDAPALSLSPKPIQAGYTIGAPSPVVIPISINSTTGNGNYGFTLAQSGIPGATLSAGNGTTPTSVNLSINTAGLVAGTYTGLVGVAAPQTVNQFDVVPVTFTINSATTPPTANLTVTATNLSKLYGAPNPALTYTVTGFVNGDTAAVLSGTPALSTTATPSSPPGNYPIVASLGTLAAANYTFTFVNGTLQVVPDPTMSAQPGAAPIPNGLTYWYRAEGNALDTQSNANGTVNNGVGFNAGEVGQAFSFNAATQSNVTLPSTVGSFGTNDFSVDFWFNTTQAESFGNPITLMGNRVDCSDGNFFSVRMYSSNSLFVELDEDANHTNYNSVQAASGLNDGKWHHVAVVRQGTTLLLYLDGTLAGSSSSSAVTNITGANPFVLGSSPCASSYTGALDEIHIFNRALSQTEVQSVYNAGSAGLTTLVGWWPFDEGTGTTTADFSGNGNLGTLSGSTLPSWIGDVPAVPYYDPSSLSFDGATNYVNVSNTGASLNFTTQVTMAAWVKPSVVQSGTYGIISKPRSTTGTGFTLRMEELDPNFALNNGIVNCSVHATSNPFQAGVWTHVAATYDSSTSTVQLYVNGVNVPVDNQGCSGPLLANGGPLYIGQELPNFGRNFAGEIDDARVYNRVLLPSEVAALASNSALPTTTTVSASPNTAIYGSAIKFTASVLSNGSPVSTGTVTFSDSASNFSSGPIALNSSGLATFTTTFLGAGTHAVSAGYTYGSGASSPYSSSSGSTNVTVTPAVLTVTPNNKSKTYGEILPALTATVTGFVNGDIAETAITGAPALSTPVAALTPAGTYPIFATQGTLATLPNYSLAFAVGTLTVAPAAAITLPAATQSTITQGGAPNFADTYTTPFAAPQNGWITAWQTEFTGGLLANGLAGVPAGVQLKVFRNVAGSLQVVAQGAVHDPRPLLQQRFGASYPFFTDTASLTTFTESPIPVLAGDLLGITVYADPAAGAYFYPLVGPAGTLLVTRNVLLGQSISAADPFTTMVANPPALSFTFYSASASNPLTLMNNFLVTGDYSAAGVTLRGLGVGGFATGTITIPTSSQDATNGIPQGAEPVGAFLYWETLENTPSPSGNSGKFRSYSITGQQIGNDVQYTDGNFTGTLRVYRADVLPYFAVTNGVRIVSGPHSVSLPDSGGTALPLTEGASLVVIYRVISPNFPLKAVVLYDGSAAPSNNTNLLQVLQGFYDADSAGGKAQARTTNIYSSGGIWNNSTTTFALPDDSSEYGATLTPGAWGAMVLSTLVKNTDHDGILNAWKIGPPAPDFHAGQAGYYDVKYGQWIPLPGAALGQRDLFVQMDYMCSTVRADGTCDPAGRSELPVTDAQGHDPLLMLQQVFANHGIALHLQLGNAIQAETCTDSPGQLCEFPNEPGVSNWKLGIEIAKLWPRNAAACGSGGDCSPRFPFGAKDSYHYVLMADSLAIPAWNTTWGTLTGITVANGITTISTTDRGQGINACPSRITITGALGNPALNGVYNTTGCGGATSMTISTPNVPNWSYPNNTLPEPVLGVTSGTVSSISGFSDLGGADSVISLGKWETSPNQDMSKRANVQAGTILHEVGHTLGLSHGGTFYDTPGAYNATYEANCKPNYQSVMNYLFQLDGVGPDHALDFSGQTLNTLNESTASQTTQLTDVSGFASANYSTSAWYAPVLPGSTATPATRHCDGSPLIGDKAYRIDGPIAPITPPWSDGQDVNFDGQLNTEMRGYNDWANLDLRQVGSTSGEFVALSNLLSFGNLGSPLNVSAGGTVTLGSGGTVALGSGGTVTLGSGGTASLSSGATIALGAGGNVMLANGGTVTLGSAGTITMGSGGNVVLGSAGAFTLGNSGGTITLGSGGTVTLGGAGAVTLGGGGTIALGSGGTVVLGAGGSYTLDGSGGTIILGSGGNVILGSGGNIVLGSGGLVTLGAGGNIALGSGGTVALGSSGTIALGSGGTVALGSGGTVTLGSGGTIALGSGGTVTLGSGGNVTLGSGGTVTLGSGGDAALASGGNVTLGSGGTVALGSGGNVTLGSGGNVTLGSGGTIALGSGGTVTLGSGGNVTLGSAGTVALGSGGNVTLGSGGTVTLGSGGLVTLGSGGTITLGSGGTITLGSGGSYTGSAGDVISLGAGGTIALGSGGTIALGSGGNVTLGSGGTITLGSGGNVTLGSGGNVTLGSGGTITLGSGGTVTLGSGGNVTLGSGGNVTLGSGGNIALGSGGNVTLGSGGNTILGSGGNVTLGSGGNTILGSGGNITLGSGGTIALGSGGTVTLGSGGSYALGSGGTVALGSGGTVALGSGGNIALGSGGTIALGSGGVSTVGSEGGVTLGSGGASALSEITYETANSVARPPQAPTLMQTTIGNTPAVVVNWQAPIFGVVSSYIIYRSDNGGPPTAIGTVTGNPPATTFTDTNPSGAARVAYTISSGVVDSTNNTTLQSPPSVPALLAQTITFTALPNAKVGDTVAVSATASSGLPVNFSTTGSCALAGQSTSPTTVNATAAGGCTVTASQAGGTFGNNTYAAAMSVAQTFSIAPATQTLFNQSIAFPALGTHNFGDPDFMLLGMASSNLPVSYMTSGACTAGGGKLHITGAGSCTVTASQSGNADYNPAQSVSRSFVINKANVSIKVVPYSVMYDGKAHTATGTATGVGGVDLSAELSLSNTTHTNVGTYSDGWSFTDSTGNYNNASGTVTDIITAAPATVSATAAGKTYGDPDPALTATETGFTTADASAITLSATRASGQSAGTYTITPAASGGALANYSVTYKTAVFTIAKAALTVTADNKTKLLDAANPAFTATYAGFKNGETLASSGTTGAPSLTTTATTTSPVGSYTITAAAGSLAASNYTFAFAPGKLTILYASGGTCNGSPGHTILPPVNSDGTSVFKGGRTVPIQFRVCDANGASIGTPGVVSSFLLTGAYNGTLSTEALSVTATNNDTAFRWDSTNQQWIFNLSTSGLSLGQTYIYTITLNDGTIVTGTTFAPAGTASFQFGVR